MRGVRKGKSLLKILIMTFVVLMALTVLQLNIKALSVAAVASSQDPVPPRIAYGSLLAHLLSTTDPIPGRQWFGSRLAEVASTQDPVPAREWLKAALAAVASGQDPIPVRQSFISGLAAVASSQDPIPGRQSFSSGLAAVASGQDPIPVRQWFGSGFATVASGQDPVPVGPQQLESLLSYFIIDLGEGGLINVNLRDGALIYRAHDLAFQNIVFDRVYNSRTKFANKFNASWLFNYDRKVYEGTDGSVSVITTSGQRYLYIPKGDGTYIKPAGATLELRKSGEGQRYFLLGDKAGNLWEYYDAAGNLQQVRTRMDGVNLYYEGNALVAVGSTAEGAEVRLLMGAGSNPESVIDPENRNVRYIQDESGRLKSVITAGEVQVTYEYSGRLMTGIIDGLNQKTQIGYDELGRVSTIKNADGQVTAFEYGDLNTVVYMPEEQVLRYNFNSAGNVISIYERDTFIAGYTWERQRLTSLTDAEKNTYRYNYDELGRLISAVDPLLGETIYTYDDYDNLTSVVDPEGLSYSFEYDRENRLIAMRDGLDQVYRYEYDTVNNYITVIDPAGKPLTYKLDGRGNFAEVQDVTGTALSSRFDFANRLALSEVYDKEGWVYAATELGYDDLHRLISIKDLAGNTLTRQFDQNGNLLAVQDQKGNGVDYTYTALNQLRTVAFDGREQYSFTYDTLGRLHTANQLGQANDFQLYYNPLGELEVTVDPEGNIAQYSYDPAGNLSGLDWTYQGKTFNTRFEYDAKGELVSAIGYREERTGFAYTTNGQLQNIFYPNGLVQELRYDAVGRVRDFAIAGTELRESYTYDANNNLLTVTDAYEQTSEFTYNALNCLTAETNPYTGERIVYKYDPAGNRVNKTVYNRDGSVKTSTDYAYRGLGGVVTDGRVYEYDLRGNLISDGNRNYVWDALNRLIQVRDRENRVLASFAYDFQGQRVSKTTAAGTTYYYYAGGRVAYETDTIGQITTMYTYDALGRPLTLTRDGVTYYYAINTHGDVLALTDGYGRLVGSYRYDAFGNITELKGELAMLNPFRYAGYSYDVETDLYYIGGNYYDADAGRFLSQTLNVNPTATPLAVNRFVYAGNNPAVSIYRLNAKNYCAICKCIWCLCHKLHPEDRVNPYQGATYQRF